MSSMRGKILITFKFLKICEKFRVFFSDEMKMVHRFSEFITKKIHFQNSFTKRHQTN